MNLIAPVTESDLPHTHRAGCPVPVTDLRAVTFTHLGFDGREHEGTLVVHRGIAEPVLDVLDLALRVRFPILKAVPIDAPAYGGDDEKSMADNNSSAFNYRPIAGTDRLYLHSYGLAVDLNPALNPYLAANGQWYPAARHIDRSVLAPGMFGPGEPVTEAFLARGFEWGGVWERPDYHHFQWRRIPG